MNMTINFHMNLDSSTNIYDQIFGCFISKRQGISVYRVLNPAYNKWHVNGANIEVFQFVLVSIEIWLVRLDACVDGMGGFQDSNITHTNNSTIKQQTYRINVKEMKYINMTTNFHMNLDSSTNIYDQIFGYFITQK